MKLYTNILRKSFENNATDLIEFLINREDIDWTCRKNNIPLIAYVAKNCSTETLKNILDNKQLSLRGEDFEMCLFNSENLENIKMLIHYSSKFNVTTKQYLKAITASLSRAISVEHIDYLSSLGADINDWLVIRKITSKAKDEIYEFFMLEILKLEKLPDRQLVSNLCWDSVVETEDKFEHRPIPTEKLKELLLNSGEN